MYTALISSDRQKFKPTKTPATLLPSGLAATGGHAAMAARPFAAAVVIVPPTLLLVALGPGRRRGRVFDSHGGEFPRLAGFRSHDLRQRGLLQRRRRERKELARRGGGLGHHARRRVVDAGGPLRGFCRVLRRVEDGGILRPLRARYKR